MTTSSHAKEAVIPEDDVFRNRLRWILEGLLEGATVEDTRKATWDFVWSHAHGGSDWTKLPQDADLNRRTHEWLRVEDSRVSRGRNHPRPSEAQKTSGGDAHTNQEPSSDHKVKNITESPMSINSVGSETFATTSPVRGPEETGSFGIGRRTNEATPCERNGHALSCACCLHWRARTNEAVPDDPKGSPHSEVCEGSRESIIIALEATDSASEPGICRWCNKPNDGDCVPVHLNCWVEIHKQRASEQRASEALSTHDRIILEGAAECGSDTAQEILDAHRAKEARVVTSSDDERRARRFLKIILGTDDGEQFRADVRNLSKEFAEVRGVGVTLGESRAFGWKDSDDRPLPEDEAIHAAFPTKSGRHDLYQEAMRLVGAKYSKGGLVALVTWLLLKAEQGSSFTMLEADIRWQHRIKAAIRRVNQERRAGMSTSAVDELETLLEPAPEPIPVDKT